MAGKEGKSKDDGDARGRSLHASGSQSRVELAHRIGATMPNITHEDILKFSKPHNSRSEAADEIVKRIESVGSSVFSFGRTPRHQLLNNAGT